MKKLSKELLLQKLNILETEIEELKEEYEYKSRDLRSVEWEIDDVESMITFYRDSLCELRREE